MSEILDLSHVSLKDRPLIVCDVDDVVLQFFAPFETYLKQDGLELLPRSFRLTGNIVSVGTEIAVEDVAVKQLIGSFFEQQEEWQTPFDLALDTLNALGADADVMFLTAMPPRYSEPRRRLLDRLGFDFPLVATEEPKGPVMRRIHGERALPCVFIDDMAHNLHSVRDHVGNCLVLHMMPDSPLHLLAPKPDDGITRAMDWAQAGNLIRAHIGR
ncbi:hypothetical protein GCM10010924_02950 [Rhizobium wenxiniae]|jgi:hypothetical protein|uniref:HAD family hydrolase n=1 Tax=Rhizobium wenxiniae TaxID=1737357 RepID=A0A7W9Y4K4_9HYPH|nr:hypothetical protein [Rhizobium wenxiniae]MBB6161871.1 hypothetical protein [Rhizobium wenxiniae]GGF79413.1 hypothetical protein GCM10010924_02950 [Rhizobium wenxiniae]